jgi:hypothetical protein
MNRIISILFQVLLLSSCSQDRVGIVEEAQYRFYDFDVLVEVTDPWLGPEEKFIIENTGNGFYDDVKGEWTESALSAEVLHYVSYKYSRGPNHNPPESRDVLVKIDTVSAELSKAQLDTVYTLAMEIFKSHNRENVSQDSVPPNLLRYHGNSAKVELDMGLRGDKYRADIRYASLKYRNNKNYGVLYDYLNKIKNNAPLTTPLL